MTKVTRDLVVDLWPVYASGEASADTRALVEGFMKEDPEFGERLRAESLEELVPSKVVLPVDHERATLIRLQQRRSRQTMLVNASALLVSGVVTAFYVWGIVPRWAHTFAAARLPLPTGIAVAVNMSTWIVRLGLPLALLFVPIGFVFRRKLRLPSFLESGIALAVITGLALVAAQLGWLALLNEASIALETAYRSLASRP
jgi:hypothetical protein